MTKDVTPSCESCDFCMKLGMGRYSGNRSIFPSFETCLKSSLTFGKMNLLILFSVIFIFCETCQACNIDTTKPIRYDGGAGDYFGYTVLQYEDTSSKIALIGAPRGNSAQQPNLERPGTVHWCRTVDPYDCTQLPLDEAENEQDETGRRYDSKANQWLGVSLARHERKVGSISACGHRYSNEYYINRESNFEKNDSYPIGVCYNFHLRTASPTLESIQKTFPCLNGQQWKDDTKWLSWCQAGMDISYTSDGTTTVIGAPGAYNSTGTTIAETSDGFSYPEPSVWTQETEYPSSYTGYSVATGRFVGPLSAQQGVAGAPRANELGKVTIYDLKNNTVYQEIYGVPLNTYFGSAVAAVDLNKDNLTDLLVGAPLFWSDEDEGKVYVYLNTGNPNEPLKLAQEVQGSKAFRARFGTSISGIGDINKDKYNDVIIGAPYENDGDGAVYIYYGRADGIDPDYAQRIVGSFFKPPVKTFGISVYGGIDMDGNYYPDILVGAYESDAAFLFRTKPIIDVFAWLELDPQSVDPDVKTCVLEGIEYVCINVTVCFSYEVEFTAVTIDLQIEYSITVDEEKIAEGISPRFLLTDQMLTKLKKSLDIKRSKTCATPFKAYLPDTARDFLAPVPLKLTYDIYPYDVQEGLRGDEAYNFTAGLPPVNGNYKCEPGTVVEEVRFAQDCGTDAVCQTDIELNAQLELPEGKQTELILGATPTLNINVRIDNKGEEAHQAILNVYHPSDMGYEGVDLVSPATCLDLADERGKDCIPEVVATCLPLIGQDTSAIVKCSLGNPMNAYNSVNLRIRFGVSEIPWSLEREINITMEVLTVSIETEAQKANNVKQLKVSLIVEADIGVLGISQPESIYYGYNATSLGAGDQKSADKAKLELSKKAMLNFYDETPYNASHIGPAFNHVYQAENFGPGRLPLTSNVTIKVPWRTLDGDWLVFIKDVKINKHQGSCNFTPIKLLQQKRLQQLYFEGSSDVIEFAVEETVEVSTQDNPRDLDCSKAKCVEISCGIELLDRNEIVKITLEALLWEYTFVTRHYGHVEVVSEVAIQSVDADGIHNQPEGHHPDSAKIKTTAFTEIAGKQPVPWWVILLAVLIGLLLLIAAVFLLWKFGFFKRDKRDEMAGAPTSTEKASDGGPDFSSVPQTET